MIDGSNKIKSPRSTLKTVQFSQDSCKISIFYASYVGVDIEQYIRG